MKKKKKKVPAATVMSAPTAMTAPRRWPWLIGTAILLLATVVAANHWLGGESDDTPEGMVWIPPGEFWMGSEEFPDARPVHHCFVDGFWIDKHEVTNAQFAAFVEATGYKTIAERTPTAEEFPGASKEQLVPFSLIFVPPEKCPPEARGSCDQWWKLGQGACWKHPGGPNTDLKGLEQHPVVHIAWDDAVAYCEWAGKRLPTEAEWERAARGGLDRQPFYWGSELLVDGKCMANVWQGEFPCENSREDGYAGTSPVGTYPANGFGLFDVSGNVWEWCSDWYQPGYQVDASGRRRNPTGPPFSIDTHGRNEPKRVQRGGSFLCSDVYCLRYRAGGRMQGEPRTSLSHTGFRCAKSAKK